MSNFEHDNKTLKMNLNVEELTPQQIRLLRSISMMLIHVLSTEDEAEFFEGSTELMRLTASCIKLSNFSRKYYLYNPQEQ